MGWASTTLIDGYIESQSLEMWKRWPHHRSRFHHWRRRSKTTDPISCLSDALVFERIGGCRIDEGRSGHLFAIVWILSLGSSRLEQITQGYPVDAPEL